MLGWSPGHYSRKKTGTSRVKGHKKVLVKYGIMKIVGLQLTELYKDVFSWIQSNSLEVLSHQDFNGSLVPVLGDVL